LLKIVQPDQIEALSYIQGSLLRGSLIKAALQELMGQQRQYYRVNNTMRIEMLFTHNGEQCLFIHIRKTGGNTIQKALLNSGVSLDKIKISGHQDGEDRFEIKGSYTKTKHMWLAEYLKHEELLAANIFTCVRKPLQRLVSLYFSPHRHITKNFSTGAWQIPRDVNFDIDEFRNIVNKTPTCLDMLSIRIGNDLFAMPTKIKIMRNESLKDDCKNILGIDLSRSSNVSPYKMQACEVSERKDVISLIENSRHQQDELFFYASVSR
jgi:hypothetical protein